MSRILNFGVLAHMRADPFLMIFMRAILCVDVIIVVVWKQIHLHAFSFYCEIWTTWSFFFTQRKHNRSKQQIYFYAYVMYRCYYCSGLKTNTFTCFFFLLWNMNNMIFFFTQRKHNRSKQQIHFYAYVMYRCDYCINYV